MAKANQKKIKRSVSSGKAYINASFNNTIVTITDNEGNVLAWSSSGSFFKGSKKATPYAGQVTAEATYKKVENYGLKDLIVIFKGIGSAREQTVRGLVGAGANIIELIDRTPLAHNGCRKKKARRI